MNKWYMDKLAGTKWGSLFGKIARKNENPIGLWSLAPHNISFKFAWRFITSSKTQIMRRKLRVGL